MTVISMDSLHTEELREALQQVFVFCVVKPR